VAFSPDGQRLASGSVDNTVKLWDARTGQELLTLRGHTGSVTSVAFSPDGQRLFSRDSSGKMLAWDASTGAPRPASEQPEFAAARAAARHPSQPIVAVAQGNQIELVDVSPPDPVELGYREGMARFDSYWQKEQAQKHQQAKNWFAAVFHWGQLVEHDSGQVSYWELETACTILGDWQSILAAYNQLLRSDSTLAPVYYRRARIRARLFQFHEATADQLTALVLGARNPIGWPRFAKEASEEGEHYAQQGDLPRAIQAFTDAAVWERPVAQHRFELAWAQLAARKETAFRSTLRDLYDHYRSMKDVEATYRLAVELGLGMSPGPPYLRGLGGPTTAVLLESMQKDCNPAIVYGACIVPDHGLPTGELVQLARQSVERARWWGYLENLGAAQYRAGRYADAITTLEEAVKLHVRGGTNWMKLFLALAYQQQKQPDKADAWLEKAHLARDADWKEQLIYQRLRAEVDRLRQGK
jgi:tetratricopeptide (TPR) repeat protein